MTRDEIETEIDALLDAESKMQSSGWSALEMRPTNRAIARLRADLARLDGPAEGTRRHWFVVYFGAGCSSVDDARKFVASNPGYVVVTADLPLPRVVEIQGEVDHG